MFRFSTNKWAWSLSCAKIQELVKQKVNTRKYGKFCFIRSVKTNFIKKYTTTILPGVVYGCDTWSVTCREEHDEGDSCFRHCATSRKVAGSIPYGVIGIFRWPNPSSCTMALWSTQPLTEMSTLNVSRVVRKPMRRADDLTTFMCRLSWNVGASTTWSCRGLCRDCFAFVHKLGVFQNRVLRKILGPKKDEVAGEWRRLRKEKLYHL
jgi:hypothetical protein